MPCKNAFDRVRIVTSFFKPGQSFPLPSAYSYADQNISSLPGMAHVRYTRPVALQLPAWLGIALPHPYGPGIGCPPNSPSSHSTPGGLSPY